MKKVMLILSVVVFLASCKEKDDNSCEGYDCPLPNGSYCPGNSVNIDDVCTCPPGTVMLNDSFCLSLEADSLFTLFYSDISCECVEGAMLLFFADDIEFTGNYRVDLKDPYPTPGIRSNHINFLPGSAPASFDGLLGGVFCDGHPLYLHGNWHGDTLNYYLYFMNSSQLDTCGYYHAYAL